MSTFNQLSQVSDFPARAVHLFAMAGIPNPNQLHNQLCSAESAKLYSIVIGSPEMQIFYRNVCHQVLNEMQEARMLVASNPYMLDLAAICDLLAAEPDNLTHPTEEPQEPFGSRALPGEQNLGPKAVGLPFISQGDSRQGDPLGSSYA